MSDKDNWRTRVDLRVLDNNIGAMQSRLKDVDDMRCLYIKVNDPLFKDVRYTIEQLDNSLDMCAGWLAELREHVREELKRLGEEQ